MRNVWIVEAEHWHIPGRPMTAHATEASAKAEAADLVNGLRHDVGLSRNASPSNFEARMETARRKRAKDMGCETYELGCSDAGVWITKLAVQGEV